MVSRTLQSKIRHQGIVLFFCCLPAVFLHGQKGYKLELGVMAGAANYLGDIGGRQGAARPFIADMKIEKTRWDVGPFVRYRITPAISVKTALHYIRIAGDDKLSYNPGRRYRNLSFRNDVFDLESTLNWHFYNSDKPMGIYMRTKSYFTAYVLAGIGVFRHQPKTYYNGEWVKLQPLRTEGVHYGTFGYCVPFGAGFYVTIVKQRKAHRIGLEINWRYTNTDYLDDISTVYRNPADLNSHLAVVLANRNPELTNQPPGFEKNYGWHGLDENGDPLNKAPRGNSDDKDSYFSVTVTYGVSVKNRYSRRGHRRVRSVIF